MSRWNDLKHEMKYGKGPAPAPKPEQDRKKRPWWHWAIGGFLAFVLLGAIFGEDDEPEKDRVANVTATTATAPDDGEATPEPVEAPPTFEDARALADQGKYAAAVALALGDDGKRRVRAYVATAIAVTAVSALRRGDRRLASRRIRRAASYGKPKAVRAAQSQLRAAQSRASARRAQQRAVALRRAADRARRAAAERARRAAEAAAVPDESSAPSVPSVPSGTCSEISATNFPVPPGDPRDRDGDGIACES